MSTLTLDRSDPEVDKLVSAWTNGSMYEVRLRIQQIGSDPKASTFHVAEVTNETPGEEESSPMEEGTAEVEAEAPAPKAKPAVKVQY